MLLQNGGSTALAGHLPTGSEALPARLRGFGLDCDRFSRTTPFLLYRPGCDRAQGGSAQSLTGAQVEAGAMPRTADCMIDN